MVFKDRMVVQVLADYPEIVVYQVYQGQDHQVLAV